VRFWLADCMAGAEWHRGLFQGVPRMPSSVASAKPCFRLGFQTRIRFSSKPVELQAISAVLKLSLLLASIEYSNYDTGW